MKLHILTAALATVAAAFAQEIVEDDQPITGVVETTPEQATASVEAANSDAQIVIDADEEVQKAFDAFLTSKAKDGVLAYGTPTPAGIIYYAAMEPVSAKGKDDPDFLKKRQTAFMRAFADIRIQYVKYTFNSFLDTTETGGMLNDTAAANRQQPAEGMGALERISAKMQSLTEAKLDAELEKCGVDTGKFGSIAARRKALCREIVRKATLRSFGSCVGICVVKTVEGRGTDGTYSIGVIAKYDPQFVVIADCMARKVRPALAPRPGVSMDRLLASGKLAENFGTRFFYDETGMPALLSFGQWSVGGVTSDRFERKLLEKSAFAQAEMMANTDMNNFIAGRLTYKEAANAGESFNKNIVYNDEGFPVGFEKDDSITDYVDWNATTTAKDSLAGRSPVLKRTVKHPDCEEPIALVAVSWSFGKLDQLRRDADLRRPNPINIVTPEPPAPTPAVLREGDTYDF